MMYFIIVRVKLSKSIWLIIFLGMIMVLYYLIAPSGYSNSYLIELWRGAIAITSQPFHPDQVISREHVQSIHYLHIGVVL